ncbi:uncharacterized protein LOC135195936 [Macrobrachium nipponense]|uniref:uncharacterized protein LOC135195936 n=1 Tax=Macrobrachium nipponense TaxID=159736 RepID=UPI0030C83097
MWNVGTLTGKLREVVDVMERRRIDFLCVQETRWKGSRTRETGNGYKLYYSGSREGRNGVGIIMGYQEQEKELFRQEFEAAIRKVKEEEKLIIAADLNGREGKRGDGYERYMEAMGLELEMKMGIIIGDGSES